MTVIGSNGAGKSTLFNAIAGVWFTDAGRIYIDGEDVTFKTETYRAHMIGRIFQDPMKGTAPSLTIEENLAIAYKSSGQGDVQPGHHEKRPGVFPGSAVGAGYGAGGPSENPHGNPGPGGQRQAITLLMATVLTPKILLLDEHTAALDPLTAEKVLKITKDIVEERKITTLMITHNMASSLRLGNRTILMDSGSVAIDLKGEEREHMDVEGLLRLYHKIKGQEFDNDRILLAN